MALFNETLQQTTNLCRTHIGLSPLTGVGGYFSEPALSLCNNTLQELLAYPFAWKFNRVEMPQLVSYPDRQDYLFAGASAFTLGATSRGAALDLATNNGVSGVGSTITVNTLEAHGFKAGEVVYLSGNTDSSFNAVLTSNENSSLWTNGWTIATVPTPTSFTFLYTNTKNWLPNSQVFTPWLNGGNSVPTITDNAVVAPDGTMTGARIDYPSTNAGEYIDVFQQGLALSSQNETLTFSVYLRSDIATTLNLSIQSWNVSTPVFETIATVNITSTWTRYSVTTASNVPNTTVKVLLLQPELIGDQTINVWGAQLEYGSTPTTYVRTGGTTEFAPSGAPGILDFGWAESATLVELNSTSPDRTVRVVKAVQELQPTWKVATPEKVCMLYDYGTGVVKFRLQYIPGNPTWGVNLVYQAKAPRKTSLTQLWDPFPDEYGFVYRQMFLASCWRYINDPKQVIEFQKAENMILKALGRGDAEASETHVTPSLSLMDF